MGAKHTSPLRRVFILAFFISLFSFFSLFVTVPQAKAGIIEDLYGRLFGKMEQSAEGVTSDGTNINKFTHNLFDAGGTEFLYNTSGVPGVVSEQLTLEQRRMLQAEYGGGAIGDMGKMLASLYTPQASAQRYVAMVMADMKLVPQAYAQGLGFAALDPILETWKTFRNVAYLFFVIIFLVIGFLIMFRYQVKGQTVITAQQAIPQIVVALIFVSFSYAIAGFIIDLMYLFMYVLVGLFDMDANLIDYNFLELGIEIVKGGTTEAFTSVNDAISQMVQAVNLGSVVAGASGLTVAIIIAVAILIGIFKLFFELVKSYVTVVLNIAFAPLILMFGALPGQNTFSTWIMGVIGNLAAFPVVLMLLIVHKMLAETNIQTGGFMPPYLLGGGLSGVLPTIIGVGILLVIPEIIKQIKKAFKAEGGIFEQLAQTMWKERVKPALPLGGRAASIPVGGGIGGAIGGVKGLAQAVDQRDPWLIAKGIAQGARSGVSRGGRMTQKLSKSIGATGPDVFNPLLNAYDRAFNKEALKERGQAQQAEDIAQSLEKLIRR